MKKLTNYIFAALLLLITAGLQAQVVEVCAGDGTDSVTLSLAQYQYGNIQWQYSEDTLIWTDVQGAHDTVFRCLPERECYYRARIEYPNCPLDTTQVTHILFTPTANAGFDRVLSEGLEIYLDGNRVDETARCMWQVIEGDSANLEDPVFRCSRFTGPDTLYKLTWTVANACGVSTDTVEIRYMHTVMYDAIAIVDTTDIILSDSAELASGIYRIIFSAPAPNITDSTVLMGIFDGGFLRRVLDFEYYGDTCEMVTSQAGMADILLEGAINLEIPLNSGSALNRRGRDFSYTRASIVNDPRYSSGQWGDLMTDIMMGGYSSSLTRNRSVFGYFSSGPLDLSAGAERIRFEDHKIYFSDGTLADVIKYDFWKDPNDRSYHAYVTLISDLHVDFTLITPDDPVTVALDVAIPTPAGFEKEGVISIGLTVPIVLSATFSGYTRIPVRMTKPIRLGAFYKGNLNPFTIVEDWRLVDNSEKLIVEKDDDIYVSDFELQLSIGGRLSFQVWKLPGFKWSILPTLAYSRCTNTTTGFQREKVSSFVKIETNLSLKPYLGVDAGLGIEDDVIDEMIWYSPTRISANTNRNLVQPSANSYIQDPIYVHVYNQDERPVRSGRKVLFEATGGVVSATPSGNGSASAFATTNASGVAQIYWKPLSSNASLKASVLDCEGYHVKGSPLYFYSNGVADLCLNSTLSLAIGNNGRFITSGGTSPFLYSSDGVSWLPEINMSYPLAAGTYFVKDANGCIASATYTVQEATPACNLTTSTYQNGLQVRLVANNGTAPYHFYVDGLDFTTSGTTQRVFQHTFAQDGEYTLTVTDANGCTQSSVVRLISNITPPTVVTLLRQNNPGGVYDLVFGAVTDNGGSAITNRGVEWSLSSDLSNATAVANNFTGDGLGRFSCQVTGVTSGTTFYVRAYAINSDGYIGYGRIITLTVPGSTPGPGSTTSCGVSSIRSNETGSNGTITAVRDHENNSYAVVQIGNQCWLKENMRATKYADGTDIPEGNTYSNTNPYRYSPNNDVSNVPAYGYFYNWSAVMHGASSSATNPSGVQGLCPVGWHVPSDAEWTQLTDYVSSQSQYWCDGGSTSIAKALATTMGWTSSANICDVGYAPSTNNSTGFSAMPAGAYNFGNYYGTGNCCAYFWSSVENGDAAYCRRLDYLYDFVSRFSFDKSSGYSVRCLRDDGSSAAVLPTVSTSAVGNVTSSSATCGGNVTSDGGANVTARGVCWSTSQNPTISDSHTTDGSGEGSFTSNISGLTAGITYYVRAYATNSVGTAYGETKSFNTSSGTSSGGTTIGGEIGWVTYTLDQPFYYDGTDNLVVVVSKKSLTYTSSLKFNCTSESNAVLYRQNDAQESYSEYPGDNVGTLSAYRPNATFTICNSLPIQNNYNSCADLIVGTGSNTSYYAPFCNFYKFSWAETIYDKTLIGSSGYITAISFYNAYNSSMNVNELRIYMGTRNTSTHSSTSDWTPASALTLVYYR